MTFLSMKAGPSGLRITGSDLIGLIGAVNSTFFSSLIACPKITVPEFFASVTSGLVEIQIPAAVLAGVETTATGFTSAGFSAGCSTGFTSAGLSDTGFSWVGFSSAGFSTGLTSAGCSVGFSSGF